MNKDNRSETIVRTALIALGFIICIFIIINAIKIFTHSIKRDDTAKTDIEVSSSDQIWLSESEMNSNRNITLSLKEAVLGASQQKKNLEVFEQKVSDIVKIQNDGAFFKLFGAKYQYVKYSGTAMYTVDLSGIGDDTIKIDEESKTLTLYIPRPKEKLDIDEEETQADDTQKIGIFSIGDVKLSEEERSEVIASVKENMKQTLEKENVMANAERMAKLSVWEIYQPVISKVSPDYTVIIEFI